MENIIVVFDISKSNALGQIRSFGEIGYSPILILVKDNNYNYAADSKYLKEKYEVDDVVEGIKLLQNNILLRYKQERVFISTGNDGVIAALNNSFDISSSLNFFNAGGKGVLSSYMSKERLCEIAEQCGLRSPKTELVNVGEMPHSINYPVFTKSLDSLDFHGWKETEKICHNEDELKIVYNNLKGNKILLQEFIEKENEYILQGVSINGGEEVFIPIEGGYYRLPDNAYGSYLYFNEFKNENRLFNSIKEMMKVINYSGVFEAEFIVEKGSKDLFFLEINFRHTLWNHTFTSMGANLNKIWMDSLIKGRLTKDDVVIKKQPYVLMNESEDFKRTVLPQKSKIFSWLKDVVHADGFVLWDKKDKKPFFSYLKHIK